MDPIQTLYTMAAQEAAKEAIRARKMYPAFNSRHEGAAVILEEVDEFWDEVKANNHPASRKEAIQAAAMLIRYAAEFPMEDAT